MEPSEKEKLVKKLQNAQERIRQLAGMFNKTRQWRKALLAAKDDINSALYDLTGDEFYKNN
jgi:lipopolysaccharide biosynthesis regulator YciM